MREEGDGKLEDKKRECQLVRVFATYFNSLPPGVRNALIDIYYPRVDGKRVRIQSKDTMFDTLDKIDELLEAHKAGRKDD